MKINITIILLSLISYCLLLVSPVKALTPTPSSTPTPKPTATVEKSANKQIFEDLKDRIASVVAQKNLVERRGVIGTVTDISDTQLTLTDYQNNPRIIDVDELTKFSSPSAKGSFGISDIPKGTRISALGLYNKQSRRLLARFVDVVIHPKTLHGAVASVDEENFSLTIILENGESTIVDIETLTRTNTYTAKAGITRSGFSKIQVGYRIAVVGFPDVKDTKRMVGSRIIVFPEIPRNPKIVLPTSAMEESDEVIPSTGSGKKLTPIKR